MGCIWFINFSLRSIANVRCFKEKEANSSLLIILICFHDFHQRLQDFSLRDDWSNEIQLSVWKHGPIYKTAAQQLGSRCVRIWQIWCSCLILAGCLVAPHQTWQLSSSKVASRAFGDCIFSTHPLTFTLKKSSRSTIMSLRKTPHLYSGSSCVRVCVCVTEWM